MRLRGDTRRTCFPPAAILHRSRGFAILCRRCAPYAEKGPDLSIQPTHRPPPPPSRPTGPAVNLPRTVAVLIAVNVGVYLLQTVLPWRAEGWIFTHLGFIAARYTLPGGFDWAAIAGPLSHQFVHGNVVHLAVNMVMLAAFGSGVERALGGPRMLVLYLMAGFAGAFAHWFFYSASTIPVVGASGAISGLFAAVLRLIARHPHVGGGLRRILPVAVIWIGLAVLTGFTGMPGVGGAQVAWAAHIGGFVFVLALFDFFAVGRPRPHD